MPSKFDLRRGAALLVILFFFQFFCTTWVAEAARPLQLAGRGAWIAQPAPTPSPASPDHPLSGLAQVRVTTPMICLGSLGVLVLVAGFVFVGMWYYRPHGLDESR